MNVTKAEVAMLNARRTSADRSPVVEGWKDGALTVFVPGKPTHYKGNGDRGTVSRHTKDWRERTATGVLRACAPQEVMRKHAALWGWTPETPKRITFTVYTNGRGFDGPDNIRLVASPCLDALGPRRPRAPGMGIIDDDKNPAHEISYNQVTKAAVPGIAIRIEILPARAEA